MMARDCCEQQQHGNGKRNGDTCRNPAHYFERLQTLASQPCFPSCQTAQFFGFGPWASLLAGNFTGNFRRGAVLTLKTVEPDGRRGRRLGDVVFWMPRVGDDSIATWRGKEHPRL
jgi:hypothetical protein